MKEIPNFPGYYVDAVGDVYSRRMNSKKNLREIPRKISVWAGKRDNYRRVNLYRDGKMFTRHVAVLMLETFSGPRPQGFHACHGPNGKVDDSLANLYWASQKQNEADKVRDGIGPQGSGNGRAILTESDIPQIRDLRKTHKVKEIAKMYGVSDTTISAALCGQNWKFVNG